MNETSGTLVADSIGELDGTAGAGATASADGRVFDGGANAKITYIDQIIPVGAKSIKAKIKRNGMSKVVEVLADNADMSESNHGSSLSLTNTFLYKEGNEITGTTGGHTLVYNRYPTDATFAKNADHLYFYTTRSTSTAGQYGDLWTSTENKIDLTNINAVKITYDYDTNGASNYFINIGDTKNSGEYVERVFSAVTGTNRTLSVDVSGLSGSYYIKLQSTTSADTNPDTYAEAKVYDIYLDDKKYGLINFSSYKGSAGKRFNLNSTISVTDNELYDIMCTWDGSTTADKVKMYIKALSGTNDTKWHNGTEWVSSIVSHATATAGSVESTDASHNLVLGQKANTGGATDAYGGTMRQVEISNVERTQMNDYGG